MARNSAGMAELRTFLGRSDLELLMILEPYTWPNCRLFFGTQTDEALWTLIVVHGFGIGAVMNVAISNPTCTVVELTDKHANTGPMTVNMYFRYNETIEPHLTQLERVLTQYPDRVIVVATDANARSTL